MSQIIDTVTPALRLLQKQEDDFNRALLARLDALDEHIANKSDITTNLNQYMTQLSVQIRSNAAITKSFFDELTSALKTQNNEINSMSLQINEQNKMLKHYAELQSTLEESFEELKNLKKR